MYNKIQKNLEKWNKEVGMLGNLRELVKEYAGLKEAKGEKDDIDRHNAKITGIIEENRWMNLEWKEIKRSKAGRQTGISKIDKKISDRKKKISDAEALQEPEKSFSADGVQIETYDWSEEIENCQGGNTYYHWSYGKMEVVASEAHYIYLRPMEKKGVRNTWISRNNVIIEVDGVMEEAKEFSKVAIGACLFPKEEQVMPVEGVPAHKIFQK